MNAIRILIGTCLRTVYAVPAAVYRLMSNAEYAALRLKWRLEGAPMPNEDDIRLMRENVTIFYKSFERQSLAKRLYRNIQAYYPGVRVVIADDSRKPLDLKAENLTVVQLPFNVGLSFGLNRALEQVHTPYVIRMDDDELLTPYTRFHEHLRYLMAHSQPDLIGVLPLSAPRLRPISGVVQRYYTYTSPYGAQRMITPHMTKLDRYTVVEQAPNIFIARTEKIKALGYDDRIRVTDHTEFFHRAAGAMVSALDPDAYIFHDHNRFNIAYQRYRANVEADQHYIRRKQQLEQLQNAFRQNINKNQ